MLFNSAEFFLFLPIVFGIYWGLLKHSIKQQNLLLLVASYFFYGWWDWRFLGLIALSTVVDYGIGLALNETSNKNKRRAWIGLSLATNLSILGFFKYYNFFIENLEILLGLDPDNFSTLEIILPVGISFYTFQTLSYTIDVFRKKIEPTKDFIQFASFVSFFPQLVAGPIERAANLLPQFKHGRQFNFDMAINGSRQILWGLFKKVVIADSCGVYADMVFADHSANSGSGLLLGAFFFSIQIYADFSGYSDIAIGVAKLFGFELMKNFNFPYFSRDIAEFWRRWHISLSTWFRDYVYIPLGGSRVGKTRVILNTFAIFLISGFWHGANWTFLAWGALNALYFLPLQLTDNNRNHLDIVAKDRLLPNFRELFQMTATFALVLIGWVFFRADNIGMATEFISGMIDPSLFSLPRIIEADTGLLILPKLVLMQLALFTLIEWQGRHGDFALDKLTKNWPIWVRYSFYYILLHLVIWYSDSKEQFIYFDF